MRSAAQRFTIVCPPPIESVGGIQSYTANLAGELSALGHHVTVVTSSYSKERASSGGAFEVERINSYPAVRGRFPIPRDVIAVRRALSAAFSPPGKLVVQARFYPLSLVFSTIARALGREVLVIDHGSAHLTIDKAAPDALIAVFEHIATAWLRLIGVSFGAVSARSVSWLRHFGIPSAQIVPNGINETLLECRPSDKKRGGIAVAYCGRLLPQKGVLELIDAVAQLRSEGSDCVLTIAGDGPLETAVRDRIKETPYARFVGRLKRDEVLALLRHTTAVVLPSSRPEGAPSIVLEAAATGAAVVATAAGDGADLIVDGQTGLLMPDASVSSIAAAIRRLHDEPELASRLAPNLRERVREGFTWRSIALKLAQSTAV